MNRRTVFAIGCWLSVLGISGCRVAINQDAGFEELPPTPPSCAHCPSDCCRVADGGFVCASYTRRNPYTFECSCGTNAACNEPQICCPPNNNPQPLLPPSCVPTPLSCDSRATGP